MFRVVNALNIIIIRTQHQQILGVHIAPSLKPAAQYDILEQKCKAFKTAINNNPLHPSHLQTANNQYIHSSIGYQLIAQRISTACIDKLQSIPLAATLDRVNMSTKMRWDLVFLPASKGGVGVIHFELHQHRLTDTIRNHNIQFPIHHPIPTQDIPCYHSIGVRTRRNYNGYVGYSH